MKKWFIFVQIILLFSLFSNVGFATESDSVVSANEAENIAQVYASNKSFEWENATYKVLTKLYDYDDSLLGYYVSVYEGDKEVGYVVVSAREDLAPVLEAGNHGSQTYRLLPEINKGNKIYYLGAMQYNYAKNKNELEQRVNDKKARLLIQLEKEGKKGTDQYNKLKDKKITPVKKDINSFKAAWKQYKSKVSSSRSTFSAEATYKELDVPLIGQKLSSNPNNACGPTTGAMIANYYKNRGYNIYGTANYGNSHQKFIDHLKVDMGTDALGTSTTEYNNGMIDHFGHTNQWPYYDGFPAEGNFTWYKERIDHNEPVAFYIDLVDDGGYSWTYHWVAGKGYDVSSYSEFVFNNPGNVIDTNGDGTTDAPDEVWLLWTNNDQDMYMVWHGFSYY
ncbi:C39 family peptidase [Laceyella tengchongensis]